jgi:hypothetical protein
MKTKETFCTFAIHCSVLVLLGVYGATAGNLALAQNPQPTSPTNPPPDLSLVPLVLVSVALDGVATPVSSPKGISRPTPEFLIPKNASKVLEVNTRYGTVNVSFSHTVPPGVPASAFAWQQPVLPTPNATGRLGYNGCASCPSSFTITVSAHSRTTIVSTPVKLNVTASTGKPELISITRNGGTEVRPRYEIRFAAGTFDPADSEAVAVYAGNLKYRLIPESSSNFAGGRMFVVIPRLKASRNVQVFLRNPYGASGNLSVELPLQQVENGPLQFNCINCSTVFGDAIIHDEYSVKHNNIGPLDASGTDEITIAPKRAGVTPCDEPDFIYHTALVKWIRDDGYSGDSAQQGAVSVGSQPPIDQLLRSPQNKVRINWTLKAFKGEHWYQVMFGVIDVVGVCTNRIVQ